MHLAVYVAVIVALPLRQFTRFIWWIYMSTRRPHQANQPELTGIILHYHPHLLPYSFYHPTEGRRLSRPGWLVSLVMYQDGLPGCTQSPIRVLTGPGVEYIRWIHQPCLAGEWSGTCVCVWWSDLLSTSVKFCVGHITGRHDSHRSLTACPLYHNMSADECRSRFAEREQQTEQKKVTATQSDRRDLRRQVSQHGLSTSCLPSSNAEQGSQCCPIGLSRYVGPSAIPRRFPAILPFCLVS